LREVLWDDLVSKSEPQLEAYTSRIDKRRPLELARKVTWWVALPDGVHITSFEKCGD